MANSRSGESGVARLVRVLETFTPTETTQTVSEIGRRAGLPSSTAHRIVADLVGAGLLERDEDRRVRIGMRLWELTTRSAHALRLRQAALPFMEQVQDVIKEHTQLVVLEDDAALCVERLSAPGSGENLTRIAGRLPLHASSSGLVLLAFAERAVQRRVLAGPLREVTSDTITDPVRLAQVLADIRRSGYAVAPGYVSAASTGAAVPVREPTGEVIAALSVVLPRYADPGPSLRALTKASRDVTRSLTRSE
jgi:DNA-binding IclR family transcriptional regulator